MQERISTARMMNYYDLRAEGDAVWLHNPHKKVGHSPKLMGPCEGPYTITKVINDVVYQVQLTARNKAKVVHRNQLWKYAWENLPNWFTCPPSSNTPNNAENLVKNVAESAHNGSEQNGSGETRLCRSGYWRKIVEQFQVQKCSILTPLKKPEGGSVTKRLGIVCMIMNTHLNRDFVPCWIVVYQLCHVNSLSHWFRYVLFHCHVVCQPFHVTPPPHSIIKAQCTCNSGRVNSSCYLLELDCARSTS